MPEVDTASLIKRCLQGDDAAHAEFYNRYEPFTRNLVRNSLVRLTPYHSPTDIDDLTNEVIIKIADDNYTRLARLREATSINAWLTSVVRNHVTSFVRREARRDTVMREFAREQLEPYTAETVRRLAHDEDITRVRAALETLDEREKLVITLYYMDQQTYAEISEALSMNINTVATYIRRAKTKLRDALGARQ